MSSKTNMIWLILTAATLYWWWQYEVAPYPHAPQQSRTAAPLLTLSDSTTYHYDTQGVVNRILTATTARYSSKYGTDITTPVLRQYNSNGTHDTIHAEHAHISADRQRIEWQHNVIAQRYTDTNSYHPQQRLETSELLYLPKQEIIRTTAALTFTTPDTRTDAIGALWQLPENLLILEQNIRTTYE